MPVQPQRAAAILLALATAACGRPTDHLLTWDDDGVPVRLEVRMVGRGDVEPLEDEARRAVARIRGDLALDRAGSALDELNRAAAVGYAPVASQDLYRAVLLALDWARASRGAFDPTIGPVTRLWRGSADPPDPVALDAALTAVDWSRVAVAEEARAVRFRDPGMALDLGPLVEGMAADAAARVFSMPGVRRGLVRVGDAGYAFAGLAADEPVRAVVANAADPETVFAIVDLANRAFAVSMPCGTTCRDVPPLDPRTGLPPARRVRAAVVVADSAADAATIARALNASSPQRAGDLLARSRRVEAALLVDDPDEGPVMLVSGSLDGRIEFDAGVLAVVGDRVRYVLPPTAFPPS